MLCMEVWKCHCIDWGISRQGCVRSCRYLDERECSKGMPRDPWKDADSG